MLSTNRDGGSGVVVLHIAEADIEVKLGPVCMEFSERPLSPLKVDLPSGKYELLVQRRGTELSRESFTLMKGESRVLMAHDAHLATGPLP